MRGKTQLGDKITISSVADASSVAYPLAQVEGNISYKDESDQPEAQIGQPVSVPISFHGGLAYGKYNGSGSMLEAGILANEPNVLRAPLAPTTITLTDAGKPPMYSFEALAPNATIAFDAASTGKTASASSLTWEHTVGSGSNRALVVGVSLEGNYVVDSVTYGGTAMTLVRDSQSTFSVSMWVLVNPTSGAANVVVTPASSTEMVGGAMSFTGINQTTPTGTAVQQQGQDATATVTVSTSTGEMVVDVVACGNQTATVGADQTQKWNDIQSTDVRGAGSYQAGADGGVMSWSLGGAVDWTIAAVPLLQALAPVLYTISVEPGEVNVYKTSLAYGDFGTLLNTKTFSVVTTPPQGRPAEWYDGSNTSWWLPLGDNEKAQRLSSIASGSSNDTWTAATDATANARHFVNVKEQLYELYGKSEIGILDKDQDPGTNANWGRGHDVGGGDTKVTDIAEAVYCFPVAERGLYEFDGVGVPHNVLPYRKADRAGQGMHYWHGGFFVPTADGLFWTRTGKPVGSDSNPANTANDPSKGSTSYFKHGRWNGIASTQAYIYGLYVSSDGSSSYIAWGRERTEDDPPGWGPLIWHTMDLATGDFNDFHGIFITETSEFSSTETRPCLFFADGNDLSYIWLNKDGAPMSRRGDIDLATAGSITSGRIDAGIPRVKKQLRVIDGWAEDFGSVSGNFQLAVYLDGGSSVNIGSAISSDGYFEVFWTQDTSDVCRSLLFELVWTGTSSLTDTNGPHLRDVTLRGIALPDITRTWTFLFAVADNGDTAKKIRTDLEGYVNDLLKYKLPDGDSFNGVMAPIRMLRDDEIRDLKERNQEPPEYMMVATVREMISS